MATTQKDYRKRGRLPRYTTTLAAFSSGMYITDQMIPEGYARVMVNYDIDDTGSHIRPRPGRKIVSYIHKPEVMPDYADITDYIYIYNENGSQVKFLKDVILSFGNDDYFVHPTENGEYTNYYSNSYKTVDTGLYQYNEATDSWDTIEEGTVSTTDFQHAWGLVYESLTNSFEYIDVSELGETLARKLYSVYSFSERFINKNSTTSEIDDTVMKPDVIKPIYTVLNNELYAIATPAWTDYVYENNRERDYSTYNAPVLVKLQIRQLADNSYKLVVVPISVKETSPIEAAATGFNMLAEYPYDFEDKPESGTVDILGMLMYENTFATTPTFIATIGAEIYLRAFYEYPNVGDTIKYKVEVLDLTNQADINNNIWTTLHDFTDSTLSAGDPLWITYIPQTLATKIRLTTRLGDDTTTDDVQTLAVYCDSTKYSSFKIDKFDLNNCKGMVTWLGRIGIYGAEGAESQIFFSDIEDAGYFPYPANVLDFETDILAVHNYLDNLLVFTVDAVWLVTPGTSIMTSTQKKILENTNIAEVDSLLVQVLKQEIFFKMNNQFYVLKPNKYTADVTDLKSYLNSTAISFLTEHFKTEMLKILNKMYERYEPDWFYTYNIPKDHDVINEPYSLKKRVRYTDLYLRDVTSTIINSEVHYIYKTTLKADTEESPHGLGADYLDIHFVYNTITRSWRLYTMCAEATNEHGRCYYGNLCYTHKKDNSTYEFIGDPLNNNIIITKLTNDQVIDDVIAAYDDEDNFVKYVQNMKSDVFHNFAPMLSGVIYPNNQYIDTGVIAVDTAFLKRYREVQFNLINIDHTHSEIQFKMYFQLDGHEQVSATQYNVYHETDLEATDYGTVYVVPIEVPNFSLYGDTSLGDTNHPEYWTVDNSKFPNLTAVNVRIELLGKGRRASLQLLNTSLKRYELAELVWIYRIMNAR